MGAAGRVGLLAADDAAVGGARVSGALHHADRGQRQERVQTRPPQPCWNAASATVVTPASRSRRSTAKNAGRVRRVRSSPSAGVNPGEACAIPSLISSRQTAGQPTARATSRASVVFPDPGGPLTMTRTGRDGGTPGAVSTLTILAGPAG